MKLTIRVSCFFADTVEILDKVFFIESKSAKWILCMELMSIQAAESNHFFFRRYISEHVEQIRLT